MEELETIVACFLQAHHYHSLDLKAVLFDMDGVLFDSMKNHTLAWWKAVTSLGIPCERDEFYQYEGATGKWTVNTLFKRFYGKEATEEDVERVYALKSRYFNALPESGPMPGAGEMLRTVKGMGMTPVLVTGSGQQSLLGRLDREFPGIFTPETMVTAFDVKRGKPDPEPYLKGLEKAGVRPEEALVVENAPLGVKAGVAAGIFTIAINTGPIPDQQLQDAGARLVYPDMDTLVRKFDAVVKTLRY